MLLYLIQIVKGKIQYVDPGNKDKDIVFGYIREAQLLFDDKNGNPYYNIPELVMYITLDLYYDKLSLGDTVELCSGKIATLRFIGLVHFAKGYNKIYTFKIIVTFSIYINDI